MFHLVFNLLEQNHGRRTKRETVSPQSADLSTVHKVPLDVPFYLSCPIDSYHAEYTWEHGHQKSPCLQMQSNCLHLIPAMGQENYGSYKCVSKEKDYTKVVKIYQLTEQKIPDTNTNRRNPSQNKNDASVVVPQIWIYLGLAILVMGDFQIG